jgi:hypothetical protein
MEDFEKGNIDINGFTNAEEALNELNVNHFKQCNNFRFKLYSMKKSKMKFLEKNLIDKLHWQQFEYVGKKNYLGRDSFFIYSGKVKYII